jgi:hypothetical protein
VVELTVALAEVIAAVLALRVAVLLGVVQTVVLAVWLPVESVLDREIGGDVLLVTVAETEQGESHTEAASDSSVRLPLRVTDKLGVSDFDAEDETITTDSVRDGDSDSETVVVPVSDSDSWSAEESDRDALPLAVSKDESRRDRDDDSVHVLSVGDIFIEGVTTTDFIIDADLVNVKHCVPAHENSLKVLTRVYGAYAMWLTSMPRCPSKVVQASCRR